MSEELLIPLDNIDTQDSIDNEYIIEIDNNNFGIHFNKAFILQAIVLLPIFVCTAYAKSIGVASFGSLITEPFGVKQKTFS